MLRRALQLTVAGSLAFCVTLHVFWLRSHFCTEQVSWRNTRGWQSIRTAAGHLEVGLLLVDWSGQPAAQFHPPKYEREPEVRPPFNELLMLCSSVGDQHYDFDWGGLSWHAKLNFKQGDHHVSAAAPCWLLAFATLAMPLAVTTWRLRRRSQKP